MLGRIGSAISSPGGGFTWTQLAAVTVFVIVVACLWRQVTHLIMGEI
jgi:hypothetical protein